jgi:choline dehydrogenase-like flavoprotein
MGLPGVGVVDAHGRVYGTNNLIVADVSISPFTTGGNTDMPARTIAWIISGLILQGTI